MKLQAKLRTLMWQIKSKLFIILILFLARIKVSNFGRFCRFSITVILLAPSSSSFNSSLFSKFSIFFIQFESRNNFFILVKL